MDYRIKNIEAGTVTSVQGFVAGAFEAGIKKQNVLDLAILYSKTPCTAAAVYTTNFIKSAPVLINQQHLRDRKAQAIVVNSGCANACTAERGMADAEEMARSAAKKLGIAPLDVLIASTGVIGIPLPMDKINKGIDKVALTEDGGHELARAMMTTDTFAKEIAIQVEAEPKGFTIGGVAKGAGMIHPNMATMLCFLATDAVVDAKFLQSALRKAVDSSFNMISVDGDTSPSDMVAILANGLARNQPLNKKNGEFFQKALDEVCLYLAKSIARDGEGATKLIEVVVEGATSKTEARLAARIIASSPLVKTAIHGNDPNWGRVVSALGRSGAKVIEAKLDAYLNHICVMKQGHPLSFDKQQASASLNSKEVLLRVNLNLGQGKAIAWGCDLSAEYVNINSAYTT
ncbi:MAG: bifunctional glutamate N-acetyltransferase/amino-acid acetyltransferase ArgJ [Chloroflexi bacterium]|nr:bifunctional glutamate N-acetyltransferase/amino-acid acetyltransferase ArgJ [Chloroflexota bacterium]MBM3155132.1 bifunctional glutamate N-acetyltransferase/amino-acid acetyltransferase ArgJ [Chloroflexota bacterium]MBM3172619.1 bifunctional glutamate N-acetyltransferase/amino-acid acetyltransferase ArgJ [Chloroflexota bacterium]MBM3174224.1 bifunctional glutamate N-acetyltransferase/amino-acid acetyltransferase ArgJ [Chloroflexota bacterium]MBM4449883.1 bifunctional glutamate N-acetyltrans